MSAPLRTVATLFVAISAFAASFYLARAYRQADVRHGVAAVQAHLYGDGGEPHLIQLLTATFDLHEPRLAWRGRVTSDTYGVVEVVLTARDAVRAVRCVWEMGLISGELVARNEQAATLLRSAPTAAGGRGRE